MEQTEQPLRTQTVVELCKRLVTKSTPLTQHYRDMGALNERFENGDQWGVVDMLNGRSTVLRDAWWDKDGVPRLYVNEYAPLLMTWTSLMTKDRPSAAAVPESDEPEDTYRAEVADKIIEFFEAELDSANKVQQAVKYAGLHGMAGLKIVYLKDEDRVSWEPLTIFGFYMDPRAHDYKKSPYYIFDDYIGEEEAEDLLRGIGITAAPPRTKYKDAAGGVHEGVLMRELWLRPCREYPKGLYAAIIGNHTVEAMEYPYVVNNDSDKPEYLAPCVLMKVRDIRDCAFGGTSFSHAVPLQRSYNELVSRIQKLVRKVTNVHLKVPQGMPEGWNASESSEIEFPTELGAAANAIGWTRPGEVSPVLEQLRDFFAAKMQAVVGLNDVTVGTQRRALSGRAIENIVELDAQKNADASKSMLAMVLEAWRVTLKLVALYYTDTRKARITNSPIADIISFNAADVMGMDVRLEPSSELDRTSAVKLGATKEKVDQGLAGPLDIERAKKSPGYGLSKAHAEQLIEQYLAGTPIDVEPDEVNLDVFLEVIAKHKARAIQKRDKDTWRALEDLRKGIEGLRATAAEQAPAEGGDDADAADTNSAAAAPAPA